MNILIFTRSLSPFRLQKMTSLKEKTQTQTSHQQSLLRMMTLLNRPRNQFPTIILLMVVRLRHTLRQLCFKSRRSLEKNRIRMIRLENNLRKFIKKLALLKHLKTLKTKMDIWIFYCISSTKRNSLLSGTENTDTLKSS